MQNNNRGSQITLYALLKRHLPEMAIFAAILGVFMILYSIRKVLFSYKFSDNTDETILYLGLTYIFLGLGLYLFKYIEGNSLNTDSRLTTDERQKILFDKIKILEKTINTTKIDKSNLTFTLDDLEKLIKASVGRNIEKSVVSNIESKYGDKILLSQQEKLIDENIERLQKGINNQIGKLSRSGTINLLIGLFTTALAIIILASITYNINHKEQFSTNNDLYIYLASRLSLALFIEIFSFFFLRLYRSSLEDIKYFQNEKTNIDFKVIALLNSIRFNNTELIAESVKNYLNVERNFILKKDESTIHLEKIKVESTQNKELLSIIGELFDKIKK